MSIKTKEFAEQIEELNPDLLIVVAYGQMIPEKILSLPRIGTINIHPSLVPKYRGPAPIQWAIINQETETGVTTMFLDQGMDTGDILMSEKITIGTRETAQTLHDRLSELGASLLIKTLNQLKAGSLEPKPQNHDQATYAPLLKKNHGHIDWNQPSEKIEAFIRGMTPWPGAFTFYNNKRYKIFSAKPVQINPDSPPGSVIDRFPDELCVNTGKHALLILEIQSQSGKRMSIVDFLRGTKIPAGTILT